MAAFRSLCEAQGFTAVRTHLVSGNAVFLAPISAADVRAALEPGLSDLLKKTARVFVRTAEDMTRICLANPFPEAEPNRVACVFLDAAPPADLFDGSKGLSGEQVRSGEREIYIHYPLGMGVSKLVLPAAKSGTARNLLTVRRLADSAEGLLARG